MEYAADVDLPATAALPSHDHLCEWRPGAGPRRYSHRSVSSIPSRSRTHTHARLRVARHSAERLKPKWLQDLAREILGVVVEPGLLLLERRRAILLATRALPV